VIAVEQANDENVDRSNEIRESAAPEESTKNETVVNVDAEQNNED